MTTDEIRALIAQKIAGQGSAVDVGGGLPTILNAICDALDAIPAPYELPVASDNTLGGIKTGEIGLTYAKDNSVMPVALSVQVTGIPAEKILKINTFSSKNNATREEVLTTLGIESAELDALMDGKYRAVVAYEYIIPLSLINTENGMVVYDGVSTLFSGIGGAFGINKNGDNDYDISLLIM